MHLTRHHACPHNWPMHHKGAITITTVIIEIITIKIQLGSLIKYVTTELWSHNKVPNQPHQKPKHKSGTYEPKPKI